MTLSKYFFRPVSIRLDVSTEVKCLFDPCIEDGWIGFKIGKLKFGGRWDETNITPREGGFSLKYGNLEFCVKEITQMEYEKSQDPFSDDITVAVIEGDVEEYLESNGGIPEDNELYWNEFMDILEYRKFLPCD